VINAAAFSFLLTSCNNNIAEKSLPNIIIFFIDDEGYGDVGCFGATGYATPNIDRMASEGMRFTNFYSGSAVSSPSRAALLTGCYPTRVGIPAVLFPYDTIGISKEETTIAELLKQKNYATKIIGKWHLGHHKEFLPLQHGFDEFFGLPYSNDMWPVNYDGNPITQQNSNLTWKINCPPLPLMDGNEKIEEITTFSDQNELTTLYTKSAVDFIIRNKDNPFFLYLPHSMAHVPLGVSEKFRGKSEQGMYGDVMMELDWSVGEIITTLKEFGLEDNTLVIYTTDNGPWLNYGNHGGNAGGLREGKGTTYEGGFRVPCIMKWPEVIPEGTVCNRMAGSIDILPTIANIVGANLPEKKIDGVNILPLLKGNFEMNPRNEYFFYSGKRLTAVRYNNWKLIFPHNFASNDSSTIGNDGWPGKMNQVVTEGGLYDLRRDPGERYNLKETYPEKVKMLEDLAKGIREELGDALQKINGSDVRSPGFVRSN